MHATTLITDHSRRQNYKKKNNYRKESAHKKDKRIQSPFFLSTPALFFLYFCRRLGNKYAISILVGGFNPKDMSQLG